MVCKHIFLKDGLKSWKSFIQWERAGTGLFFVTHRSLWLQTHERHQFLAAGAALMEFYAVTRKGVHLCAESWSRANWDTPVTYAEELLLHLISCVLRLIHSSTLYLLLLCRTLAMNDQKIAMILIASGSIEIMCKTNKIKQNACSSFGHLAHTYHFGDFGPKELVLKHRRSWYWMIRWCISFLQIRALNFQPSKQGLQPLTLQPNSSQIFFHQTSCGRTVAMAFPGGIKVLESWLVPPSLRTCFKNDANLLSLKLLDAEVIPGSTSENLAWEWPLNSFFF